MSDGRLAHELDVEPRREVMLLALYESTSFMMGLVELLDDDSDIIHVYDSPATYRFFGRAPGSMAGKSARELGVPPAVIATWAHHYREAERTRREVAFEYEHATSDGSLILLSKVAWSGVSGAGRASFSYVTEDITDRRRAEQRLVDREMHLRFAMQASLAIAFEWDIPRDRVRRLQSAEAALPETEDGSDTFANVTRVVHPEDRATFEGNVAAALASPSGAYRSEFRILRPTGEVRWLFETGRVEHDEQGRPLRLIGISQDVTERYRAEEEIRRQARLINVTHDPIMVWSAERGIVEWNAGAERLYGYTRAEVLGRDVHALLETRRSTPLEVVIEQVRTGGEWTGELVHRAKDGRLVTVESRQQAIKLDDGVLILESNRDITERKRAEAQLREADRRKDEFIAVLAHELRNPLAPVRNAVEILRRVGPTEPRIARARDVIDRQVSHMARLIDDLLDVSRIARGRLSLKREICDFGVIAAQTAEDYRASLGTSGIELEVSEGESGTLWVDGDPVRLAQMVGNLLNNAGRFTPRGGKVVVRAEASEDGRCARVTVRDTGVGIERELLERLFDPFSQAQQDLARTKGGLGLGLALTKGLVELHGGRVSAESEGTGRGSTFALEVPLATPPRRDGGEDGAAGTSGRGLGVLIIEDNHDAARTLGELLELVGHRVRLAYDGASGVAAARAEPPDVVICDIGLPGELDGYDVARTLRAEPSLAGVVLYALSGYANDDARQRSHDAGFDAHFAKPPDLDQLLARLAEVRPHHDG